MTEVPKHCKSRKFLSDIKILIICFTLHCNFFGRKDPQLVRKVNRINSSNIFTIRNKHPDSLENLLPFLGALKNLLMPNDFSSLASVSTSSIFLFTDFELPSILTSPLSVRYVVYVVEIPLNVRTLHFPYTTYLL